MKIVPGNGVKRLLFEVTWICETIIFQPQAPRLEITCKIVNERQIEL